MEALPLEGVEQGALVQLTGSLDSRYVKSFHSQMLDLPVKEQLLIVVDMSRLEYVDSSGLATLVNVSDELKKMGGQMVLTQLPVKVDAIFSTLGFHAFFEIRKSQQEAAEFLATLLAEE